MVFAGLLMRRMHFRSKKHFFLMTGTRNLLSDASTKMENFMRRRIFQIDHLCGERKANLQQKLMNISTPTDAKHASHDIVDLIYSADSKEDIILLKKLLTLLSSPDLDNSNLFNFGLTMIRLYHFLGLHHEAYSMFKDQEISVLMQDITCHKVLMDLLYNNNQYHRALEVFSNLEYFNIDCVTLALGAHYHLNTIENCEAAQRLVTETRDHHYLSRRAIMFAAMIAFNQNKVDAALEMLNLSQENTTLLNMKLMCWSRLGDISVLFAKLHKALERSQDITKPFSVRLFSDTMSEIRQAVKSKGSEKDMSQLHKLDRKLSLAGVLSVQVSTAFLDRTIPGDSEFKKESGKPSVINSFPERH